MKEFQCEICEKLFNTKNYLKKHYNRIHNNSGKVSTCNVCTKSFRSKQDLTIHIKTCHRGKHYKCDSCITGYSLRPDLANAATVSVSLLEGNMKEGSQIRGKMVLKRQDLEIL